MSETFQLTHRSYRDMLRLLLPFASETAEKATDKLLVEDLSEGCVRNFLIRLGDERHCSASTHNQRLAGIRSLARFIAMHAPEYTNWYGRLKVSLCIKAVQPSLVILKKTRWMRCWLRRMLKQLRGDGIAPFYCLSIILAPERTRSHT
ncbi:site-specific integrase [Kosakonia sp. S42]|nr:site-specific integrase [Kosakonia sp. S42]